jgi:hypothetical protein
VRDSGSIHALSTNSTNQSSLDKVVLSQYRGRSRLLDANLLLVLAIGRSDPLLIARHKKTKGEYTPEDYFLLCELIAFFAPCVTTPHVLTEVSNQLGQAAEPLKHAVFEGFAFFLELLVEHHVPSRPLADHDRLADFGLTDVGIHELATKERSLVITADARLAAYLGSQTINVIDFRHIKMIERNW